MCCNQTDDLEEEVVRLTTENAALQQQVEEGKEAGKCAADLKRRLGAVSAQLEAAQARLEEMRLDADDMRQSYRLQLDQLAQENERLRGTAGGAQPGL